MKPFAEQQILSLSTSPAENDVEFFSRVRLVNAYLSCVSYNALDRITPSSYAVKEASHCNVPFSSGLASALLTFGGHHAPIDKIMSFIEDGGLDKEDGKFLGWGNSFQNEPEESLFPYFLVLSRESPSLSIKINSVSDRLRHKNIFPNAGLATATLCLTLSIPKEISIIPLVMARLCMWGKIYTNK